MQYTISSAVEVYKESSVRCSYCENCTVRRKF